MASAKKPAKKPNSSVATKTNSTSKKSVANTGKKKQSGIGSLISAITQGKRKWVTIAAFVLIFGGLGTYFLRDSHAMVSTNSSYCVGNTWGGSKKTGQCVKDIQRILNGVGGTYSVGTADGAYGSKTLAGVKNFQRFWGLSPVDGVVGAKTWERLCYVAYYNGVDSTNAANNAGCKGASGAYVVGSGSGTTPATYAWYTIGSENASGSSIILQIADNYQRSTGGGWQFQKVTLQPGYRYRVCANISGNGTFRFGSNGVIRSVKSSSGKLMYCGAEYEVLRATQYAGKYSITLVSGYINVYDVWLQQYRIQK